MEILENDNENAKTNKRFKMADALFPPDVGLGGFAVGGVTDGVLLGLSVGVTTCAVNRIQHSIRRG